jgi:hypothetical protein
MANLGSTDTPAAAQSLDLPNGYSPAFEEDSGDLVINDSNGNTVFRWDDTNGQFQLAAPLDADGNDVTNVGALGTDELNNRIQVTEGDDLVDIINNQASSGDLIEFDGSQTTFTVSSTLTPPTRIELRAGARDNIVIKKGFDGTLIEADDENVYKGIEFNCNKANHTGDGVVDAANDTQRIRFVDCTIKDAAGDNRVHDGHKAHRYINTKIQNADGWGLVNTETGAGSVSGRRVRFDQDSEIRDNGSGAVRWEAKTFDDKYFCRVQGNDGPAFEFAASGVAHDNIEIGGDIVTVGDPTIFVSAGSVRGLRLTGHIQHDSGTQTVTHTSPLGTVHVESTSQDSSVVFAGSLWEVSRDDSSYMSNQSANNVFLSIMSGEPRGAGTFDGSLQVAVSEPHNWVNTVTSWNISRGLGFDVVNDQLVNLKGRATEFPDEIKVGDGNTIEEITMQGRITRLLHQDATGTTEAATGYDENDDTWHLYDRVNGGSPFKAHRIDGGFGQDGFEDLRGQTGNWDGEIRNHDGTGSGNPKGAAQWDGTNNNWISLIDGATFT